MEAHSEEYLRENGLIREMMKQGEFICLVDLSDSDIYRKDRQFIVQWWCRKTDKIYESAAPTLMDALCSVLGQAHEDPDPWVTEEQCAETAEKYGINICIPGVPGSYKPRHMNAKYAIGDALSRCLGWVPEVSEALLSITQHAKDADDRLLKVSDVRQEDDYFIIVNKLQRWGWSRAYIKDEDLNPPFKTMWIKPWRTPIIITVNADDKLEGVRQVMKKDLNSL